MKEHPRDGQIKIIVKLTPDDAALLGNVLTASVDQESRRIGEVITTVAGESGQ